MGDNNFHPFYEIGVTAEREEIAGRTLYSLGELMQRINALLNRAAPLYPIIDVWNQATNEWKVDFPEYVLNRNNSYIWNMQEAPANPALTKWKKSTLDHKYPVIVSLNASPNAKTWYSRLQETILLGDRRQDLGDDLQRLREEHDVLLQACNPSRGYEYTLRKVMNRYEEEKWTRYVRNVPTTVRYAHGIGVKPLFRPLRIDKGGATGSLLQPGFYASNLTQKYIKPGVRNGYHLVIGRTFIVQQQGPARVVVPALPVGDENENVLREEAERDVEELAAGIGALALEREEGMVPVERGEEVDNIVPDGEAVDNDVPEGDEAGNVREVEEGRVEGDRENAEAVVIREEGVADETEDQRAPTMDNGEQGENLVLEPFPVGEGRSSAAIGMSVSLDSGLAKLPGNQKGRNVRQYTSQQSLKPRYNFTHEQRVVMCRENSAARAAMDAEEEEKQRVRVPKSSKPPTGKAKPSFMKGPDNEPGPSGGAAGSTTN